MGLTKDSDCAVNYPTGFRRIFGFLDTFFDEKFVHKEVTTVCFRRREEALLCLKALLPETQSRLNASDPTSRTSLLISSKQGETDSSPNWTVWEEHKDIEDFSPRIAVLVESSDLIELRKKVAFYLQCLNIIGKLLDEFGGDTH
ncbi:hypothetical protein, conserved [Eimeria necatrix]|uniref:Uncharacterized protein n=1 Tax=Eimeria necatrix TaxID=51315 RepID=U6N687_9EIME|nr:hypothetical protein, conserved [Eimeria necatrix]CDJ70200.1 hypothetical protein, conserved [Eimeria necatrix]